MAQPWPEPADQHLPVRIQVVIHDEALVRPDGLLTAWLREHTGAAGYRIFSAGIPGRPVWYLMLPSFVSARLLLEDWAGRVSIDCLPVRKPDASADDGQRRLGGSIA